MSINDVFALLNSRFTDKLMTYFQECRGYLGSVQAHTNVVNCLTQRKRE
jgi:hypothetical protein